MDHCFVLLLLVWEFIFWLLFFDIKSLYPQILRHVACYVTIYAYCSFMLLHFRVG